MLTEKEIKFLNFLYKRLKGAHLDYTELKEYIKKNLIRFLSNRVSADIHV